MSKIPNPPITETELDYVLSTPNPKTVEAIVQLNEPVMILGVGGKMGPNLAELFIRAGLKKVIGVDLFPNPTIKKALELKGIECIQCDLLNETALQKLPEIHNIFLLAGFKFGATGNEPLIWAMNAFLPGLVMQRFKQSRIIYLSSGNVYRFSNPEQGGSTENEPVEPIGEYAQSRLAGERIVQFCSQKNNIAATIVRLFYASELRYGIILDLAEKIKQKQVIDLSMGYFNQIWQGDAINYLAQMLPLCTTPARIINLTGEKILSSRQIARQLGNLLGETPKFTNTEQKTALLGNATALFEKMGKPETPIEQLVEWVAWWVQHDKPVLGKPTKFEKRDGKF